MLCFIVTWKATNSFASLPFVVIHKPPPPPSCALFSYLGTSTAAAGDGGGEVSFKQLSAALLLASERACLLHHIDLARAALQKVEERGKRWLSLRCTC